MGANSGTWVVVVPASLGERNVGTVPGDTIAGGGGVTDGDGTVLAAGLGAGAEGDGAGETGR